MTTARVRASRRARGGPGKAKARNTTAEGQHHGRRRRRREHSARRLLDLKQTSTNLTSNKDDIDSVLLLLTIFPDARLMTFWGSQSLEASLQDLDDKRQVLVGDTQWWRHD